MMRLHPRIAGDTIVEVLIALTVTTALLAGAYATTNTTLIGSRSSQERAEALQVAVSQAEILRSMTSLALIGLSTHASFCLDTAANPLDTASAATVTAETNASFSSYAGGCVRNTLYHVSIIHPGDPNVFTIRVRWQRADGRVNQELPLTYTAY